LVSGRSREAAARHRVTYVVGHDGGVRTAASAAVAAPAAWSLRRAISSTMEVVYGTSVRLVSLLSRFARAPENADRRRAIPSSTSGAADPGRLSDWLASARFTGIPQPQFSEANFYDAAIQALDRLAGISGRKALLIITTGIDSFRHANFEDLLKKAEAANTPVYMIGLGDTVRQSTIDRASGPLAPEHPRSRAVVAT
jgi:hypothetical protein